MSDAPEPAPRPALVYLDDSKPTVDAAIRWAGFALLLAVAAPLRALV